MTAETLTSTRAASGFPTAGPGLGGNLKCAYGSYDIAAVVEDGDIFELCRLPAGATVVGGWLIGADIDTGTETLDMDLGWAANGDEVADPDGFGNLGVWTGDVSVHVPVAGNFFPVQGVLFTAGPKTFNAETIIQVEANAASNAGHTGMITVVILYVMEG